MLKQKQLSSFFCSQHLSSTGYLNTDVLNPDLTEACDRIPMFCSDSNGFTVSVACSHIPEYERCAEIYFSI